MRRVLFDEQVPRKLRRFLRDVSVSTTQEEGWSSLTNGDLLARASRTFDVLLTLDRRMRFQQNIARFDIGVVVIEGVDTTLPNISHVLHDISAAVEDVAPGTVVVVKLP